MQNKSLSERIAEHKEEIRLWQESYNTRPDGANTTALHDLKNGLKIIEELYNEIPVDLIQQSNRNDK